MRIRWRARELQRTCLSCGYAWQVPRAIAKPRMRGLDLGAGGRVVLNDVIAHNAALGEQAASLKQCPHCGSTRYRQKLLWS